MTHVVAPKAAAKPATKAARKVVNLDTALRPMSKAEIQARLARNRKAGKVAEMSFADAGLKPDEL